MKFGNTFHRWRALSRCALLLLIAPTAAAFGNSAKSPIVMGAERLASVAQPDLVEIGELLLSELRCVNCHQPDDALSERFLVHPAPRLDKLPNQIHFDYLVSWLRDPGATKPGSTMPHLLSDKSGLEQTEIATAIAQYLFSDAQKPQSDDNPAGSAENGRTLFHSIGCVACHEPDAEFKPAHTSEEISRQPIALPSVPLGNLREKYIPSALADFLFNPLANRPSAHMPRTPMSKAEARDLSRYLLGETPVPLVMPRLDPAAIQRGKEYYQQLRCGTCHSADSGGNDLRSAEKSKPLLELINANDQGCLADVPSGDVPNYNLSPMQRQALRTALANLPAAKSWTVKERARRMVTSMNCLACHERDGIGGPEPGRAFYFQTTGLDLEDEGRFPPRLTSVGRKLVPEALTNVLQGRGAVRPYMVTRMPDFGSHGPTLAECFAKADLNGEIRPTPRDGKEDQVGRSAWGRELVGVTGLSCISCHNLNGKKSLGISAMDLALAPKRLQPEWFRDYLIDPAHFRPGTRMPSFWPEGKAVSPLIGGNTARQIDSIWVYLNEVDQNRLPEGMENKGQFELKPEKFPIIFRTFMKDVGFHAIAVGFPQGISLAFDAESSRWALAWKGRFLDAEGTWDDRFAPLAAPLGTNIIRFPSEPVFMREKTFSATNNSSAEPVRFEGYRLNEQSTPTFLYRIGSVQIEDVCTPDEDGKSILRTFQLSKGNDVLWFPAAEAKQISLEGNQWNCGDYKVSLLSPLSVQGEIVERAGYQTLLVPIHFGNDGRSTLRMKITW
jgi:mono/diheme cytochrome c family protein